MKSNYGTLCLTVTDVLKNKQDFGMLSVTNELQRSTIKARKTNGHNP